MAEKKKELRIGVIGAGGRGGLSRNAHHVNGAKVVAICDIKEDALTRYQEFIDTKNKEDGTKDTVYKTNDYKKLLARKDVDAVFITTPDYCHEEMAVAALKAGKTVYCEKPLAITIEGCDRILKTAMETGSKLFVGHNMRHMDYILKMKELIDSGIIGQVQACWCRHFIAYGGDAYFKDWHSEQKNTTGLLLQKGAHDIDVIHWLCGGYTQRVVGMGRLSVYNRTTKRRKPEEDGITTWSNDFWPPLEQEGYSPVIDVEDESTVMMQLDNGIVANYMQCHYTPDACRNYTFIGDKGRIENLDESHIGVFTNRYWKFGDPDIVYRMQPTVGGHGGADPEIVKAFIKFAKGEGTIPSNSPIAARNSVATGVLGSKSIRNKNEAFDIPPVDKDVLKYFANGQKKAAPKKAAPKKTTAKKTTAKKK